MEEFWQWSVCRSLRIKRLALINMSKLFIHWLLIKLLIKSSKSKSKLLTCRKIPYCNFLNKRSEHPSFCHASKYILKTYKVFPPDHHHSFNIFPFHLMIAQSRVSGKRLWRYSLLQYRISCSSYCISFSFHPTCYSLYSISIL